MAKEREVGVRLSVKDADLAKRALATFGAEGQAAIKRIEAASVPASAGLLRLSNAIQWGKEYSREFAVEATRSFLGPLAAIGSAAGAMELLRDAIERVKQVAELGDIADRIGLDVGKLQGLQDTFKEAGNDVADLTNGLQTCAAKLSKAAVQGGPLKDIFDANRLKISGDTLTDLKAFADLVKNARTEQDKLYLTTVAFGRGSKEMADLLSEGSVGIGRAADEAERLGAALDAADVEKARAMTAQLAELNIKLDAAKDRFALLLGPAEVEAMSAFADGLERVRDALAGIASGDPLKAIGLLATLARSLTAPGANIDYNGLIDQLEGRPPVSITVHGGSHEDKPATTSGSTAPTVLPAPRNSAADAAAKRIKDVTDALRQQLAVLGLTDREAEISNNLSRAKVDAASKEGKTIADLTGRLYDQQRALKATNDATMFLAQTGEQVFEKLIDGTESWQDALGDLVSTMEKAVLQAALLGDGPLAGILGTQSATSGQPGGVFGSLLAGLFGGAKSGGGYVPGLTGPKLFARGGVSDRPALFGDAGPEAAVPLPDGRTIPVTLKGGSSGLALNVQIVHMPGSGTDSVTATRDGEAAQLKALVYSVAAEGVSSPGNPIHRALRRTFALTPDLTRR